MFSSRLKSARINAGLTQVELAKKLGMNKSVYNRYETTETKPSHETIILLSQILNVSIDYLFGRTDRANETVGMTETDLDTEWLPLIQEAIAAGITPDLMKEFIKLVNRLRKK